MATTQQNPTLFPTQGTYDVPSPVFPTATVDNPVPEGFEGTVSSNIPSTASGTIVPWTSTGQTYAAGAIASYLGNFYINLTGSNTGNPVSDTTDWLQVYNISVGVGTPTAPLSPLPPSYTTPDASFPAPPVTPAGTLSGTPNATTSTALGVYPNIPSIAQAALLSVYASGTTYAKNNVVYFDLAVSAWAVGTTYAKGVFVTRQVNGVAGLTTAVFMSQAASNTGNDPMSFGAGASFLSEGEETTTDTDYEWWIPIALHLVTGTTYRLAFMSLADANVGNTPAANSASWQAFSEGDALGLTREGGPLTFPPQYNVPGQETEVWSTNNQFGTTSTSTLVRTDAARAVGSLTLQHVTLSFAHTTTGTSNTTLKDPAGTTVTAGTQDPGYGLVPLIGVSSSDITKATVAVVQSTGVITVTGVAAGSCTITVTWGQLTATIAVTLS